MSHANGQKEAEEHVSEALLNISAGVQRKANRTLLHIFCNNECREDYDKEMRMNQINGKL
jgi:hypothetical protein